MICKYCGSNIPEGSAFCINCGAKAETNVQSTFAPNNNTNNQSFSTNYSQPNTQNNAPNNNINNSQKKPTSPLSIASLVLGILSIISLCEGIWALLMGIVAIVLACIDKTRSGIRTAGLITGIVGTVISLIINCLILAGIGLVNSGSNFFVDEIEKSISKELNSLSTTSSSRTTAAPKATLKSENIATAIPSNVKTQKYDWVDISLVDNNYEVVYTSGVPGNYMITNTGSFKNVCDWLSLSIIDYPVETFRHVFSLHMLGDNGIKELSDKNTYDEILYYYATLASVASQIDHDTYGGSVNKVRMPQDNRDIVEYIITNGKGYDLLQWDTKNLTLKMSTNGGRLIPYGTTTYDTKNISIYMFAIEQGLKGEKPEL